MMKDIRDAQYVTLPSSLKAYGVHVVEPGCVQDSIVKARKT